jgi:hypothetical protein
MENDKKNDKKDKKYVFIATHDNRLQCFFNKLIHDNKLTHDNKIKMKMKRFKNCAIIHLTCENSKIKFDMIYEGDIDKNIEKENLFWTKKSFFELSSLLYYNIYDEKHNYDNIEIFLIRHGKGKHNINLTQRKKMGAMDAFKYLYNSKKMNESHQLIDAELTNGTEPTIEKKKNTEENLNGISNAIKAGDKLKEYLESKTINLTTDNCILGASRLRRTRQTIGYVMYQILQDIANIPIYIFPCVYEIAKVDIHGNCDKESKIKTALAFENKSLCKSINSTEPTYLIDEIDICKKITLYKDGNIKNNNDDNKFSLDIDWKYANKHKECNDMIKSCYQISTDIIKDKNIKQKYLKYKIKYLQLKQILNK